MTTVIVCVAPDPTTCGGSAGAVPALVNAVLASSAVIEVPLVWMRNCVPP